ncbi:DUF2799 domain-containing protein [Leclercia adecarboxylata]|uniref:DUF2799 domain-containing protein n=1 Tax=Leclercia adecarboxylata TaxID=83655 RepID=UPI00202A9FAE|nr:DUF2799 domain-containing protein [Leclercia adecarboxylata]URN98294.1 DUF2799 domain-containing protein [Leclercia adecarboxylata]
MRPIVISLLGLLLTACQIDPYTHQPDWTGTDWYDAGKEDALGGVAVKSSESLAANFNDPKVDRPAYLKGYKEGQEKICQENFVYAWGLAGKIFPASCDTADNATQLRTAWQQGMDEGTKASRLN